MKSRGGALTLEPFCEVYAIKSSPKLETPAIFFSYEDARCYLVDHSGTRFTTSIEFKTFRLVKEAAEYVLKDHPILQLSLQDYSTDAKRKKDVIGQDVDENDHAADSAGKRQKTTTNKVDGDPRAVHRETSNAANLPVDMNIAATTRAAITATSPTPPPLNPLRMGVSIPATRIITAQPALHISPPAPPGYCEVPVKVGSGRLGVNLADGLVVGHSERPNMLLGDILVRVNGTSVVGWPLPQVVKFMHETSHLKERVLLVHRPMSANALLGLTTKHQAAARARPGASSSKRKSNQSTAGLTRRKKPTHSTTAGASSSKEKPVTRNNPAPHADPGASASKEHTPEPQTTNLSPSLANNTNEMPAAPSPEQRPTAMDRKRKAIDEFDTKFRNLQLFKEEYGDTDVPYRKASYRVNDRNKYIDLSADYCKGLGLWVQCIRKQYKLYLIDPDASLLSKDQAWNLRRVGLCMNPKRGVGRTSEQRQPAWDEERYQELLEYHDACGHCDVPTRPKTPLRKWTDRIRQAYSDLQEGIVATITDEEIAKLSAIGFDFSEKVKLTWEENYQRWRDFKAANPDGKEPRPRSRLAQWAYKNRKRYNAMQTGEPIGNDNMPLAQGQLDKLNLIGFDWNLRGCTKPKLSRPKTFDERLEELKEYKQKYGDCLVPQLYPGLGMWANKQVEAYKHWKIQGKRSSMTQERYDKLIAVGFSFERRKMGPRFRRGVDDAGAPHPLQHQQLERMIEERRKERLALATNNRSQPVADNDEGSREANKAEPGDARGSGSATMEEEEEDESDGSETASGDDDFS